MITTMQERIHLIIARKKKHPAIKSSLTKTHHIEEQGHVKDVANL